MATTSIWRVKGWLGKVVIYVENPDKTDNPAFYEKQYMSDRQAQGLSDVIDYAVNSEKTQTADEAADVVQQFVSGVNCHPGTAREEMLAVKRQFGKEDGTVAYHGYQSFAPGEATPELAHEIGVKLAKQLWGEKYQVIVATHRDKSNHLHNHFVVNTVSFLDGIKYHRTGQDYRQMREASDALCREYGLSVIDQPEPGKSKQYGEWRAEQENRPTWRGMIRAEIDEVIRQSMTERQFFENLRKRGYEIKVGADISVRGKELKVFTISEEHLKQFATEAKRYGVVYCALRGKEKSADGMVDVMVRAEDASKINRIVERFHLATVDTASIKHEIEKARAEKSTEEKKEAPTVPEKEQPEKNDADKLLDELLGVPTQKEEPTPINPSAARMEKSHPSAPISEPPSKAAEGVAKSAERPSVRKELRDIQAQRRQQEAAAPVKEPERRAKSEAPAIQHKQPSRKKKKAKER